MPSLSAENPFLPSFSDGSSFPDIRRDLSALLAVADLDIPLRLPIVQEEVR